MGCSASVPHSPLKEAVSVVPQEPFYLDDEASEVSEEWTGGLVGEEEFEFFNVAMLPPSVSEYGSGVLRDVEEDDEDEDGVSSASGSTAFLPPSVSQYGSFQPTKGDYLECDYTPATFLPPSVSDHSSLCESSGLTLGNLSFASETYSSSCCELPPVHKKAMSDYLDVAH